MISYTVGWTMSPFGRSRVRKKEEESKHFFYEKKK